MSEDEEQAVAACRAWLTRVVDIDCRAGGYDEENILAALEENIVSELGGPHPALLAELSEKMRAGLDAQEEVERGFPARTVNDAIESAFTALTFRGVLAVEGLGSTTQEGWARAEALAQGVGGVRGCAFFHRQDLERAVDGEGLVLAFGALDGEREPPAETTAPGDVVRVGPQRADRNVGGPRARDAEATCAIGREVVAVLKHYGVETRWDGSAHTRIVIPPFPWQKRRTTAAAPPEVSPPLDSDLGAPAPAPAAPPACPDCRGRGWLPPLQEGWGSELCHCKGGKRRTSAPVEQAPAPVEQALAADAPPVAAPPAAAPPAGLLGRIKRWFQ